MSEELFPIKGYEGIYAITQNGKVWSYPNRIHNGLWLKQALILGYKHVSLRKRMFKVHRLIAQSFILNPENKPWINHIDGDRANNEIGNLEWSTPSENNQHAYDIGLKKPQKGERNAMSKLKEHDVDKIREMIKYGYKQDKIAADFNVRRQTIGDIKNGKIWGWYKRASENIEKAEKAKLGGF